VIIIGTMHPNHPASQQKSNRSKSQHYHERNENYIAKWCSSKTFFFLFTISSIFSESKSLASSTRALKLSMSLSCLHNITMHKHFQSKYKALLNHKYHTRQYFQQPGFVSLTFSPKKELKKSRILHCQSIQVLFTFYAKSNNNNDNVVRNQ